MLRNIILPICIKTKDQLGEWKEISIPHSTRSIVCLNLPCFPNRPNVKEKYRNFKDSFVNDQLLEVICFKDAWHGDDFLPSKDRGECLAQLTCQLEGSYKAKCCLLVGCYGISLVELMDEWESNTNRGMLGICKPLWGSRPAAGKRGASPAKKGWLLLEGTTKIFFWGGAFVWLFWGRGRSFGLEREGKPEGEKGGDSGGFSER
ncbi:hypothetical protein VitviT2T_004056 [Vitis vinifera]|nr:hypothetical protein VitviT2T_004056 [Vitis vinifera]